MSLNTFSTALSGLTTNSEGLNVVGNNLANLNTVGFKQSSITFSEILGQEFSTPGSTHLNHVGYGSQVQAVRAEFSQGGVQTSSNPLDVAIQGPGMLVVNDNGSRSYTRSGNMHLDQNGYLVSSNGSNIQGYTGDPTTGLIDKTLGIQNLQVPPTLIAPTPTDQFELGMNLDAGAPTGTNFSVTVEVFDSQGTAHMATLSMQKEISSATVPVTRWRYDLTLPTSDLAGADPNDDTPFSLLAGAPAVDPPAMGALVFDGNGKLTSAYLGADPTTNPPLTNLTVPGGSVTLPGLADGATISPMNWKLIADNGTSNVSGYAGANQVTLSNHNGSPSGTITSVAIQPDGILAAVFSNGESMQVGQIVLAQFSNMDGLTARGGGFFGESPDSGAARLGTPGEGGQARLMSGALEQSNVDLATELTKIITFQRGYQASAKIITTTDQIIQDTLNLKQ